MLLDFVSCVNEKPEWWAAVFAEHDATVELETRLKSVLTAVETLLLKYREVARAETSFREEISKLRFRDVLPTADANSLRVIVTTMQELEASRRKLADNLDRNVRREIVQLYSGSENQSLSCKSMKESRKSLDKIADEHEEKLGRYLAMTNKTKPEELKDATSSLNHYRTSFKNLALDYTFRQNVFHFEQRSAILSVLSQAMNAFQAYHKEGAAATKSIERDMSELSCRQQELQTQQEQV